MENVTRIWELYEKGVNVHRRMNLVANTEKAFRFYEGDQWYGLESGEPLPFYNFIAPTVNFKVASVASNQMSVYFSDIKGMPQSRRALDLLNHKAAMWWEKQKMDSLCWKMLKESAIAGDSYLYFYDADGNCQMVDNTNIFLGDETQADLQKQPYILIYERQPVDRLRKTAARNGVPEEMLSQIVSDARAEQPFRNDIEDDGKCGCVLYMTLREGNLYFSRSTRYAEIEPERCVPGMRCYPLAALVSNPKKGSARGNGDVLPLIANQIEVNRNLVRRIVNAKMTAFSRLVYATDKIDNPEDLNTVGTAIAVNDSSVADVRNAVDYVTPSPMSADAKSIADEMLQVSRELAGAGNTSLGNIDPTQASGVAIIAVRDQAKIPLTEITARFKQFVEDVALIWYQMWLCYAADEFEKQGICVSAMRLLEPSVRIDVTDVTPLSKYTREQTMQSFFEKGAITFEEFVRSLDDDAAIPKSRLMEIIKEREISNEYQ